MSHSGQMKRTASESSNGSISDYNSSHSTTAEPLQQPYRTNANRTPVRNERIDTDPGDSDVSRGGGTSVGDNVIDIKPTSIKPKSENTRVPKQSHATNLPSFPISDQKDDISGRERDDSLDSLNRVTFGQSDFIAYQFLINQISIRRWIENVLSITLDGDLGKALKDGVIAFFVFFVFFFVMFFVRFPCFGLK
jgi:hypothetical protein